MYDPDLCAPRVGTAELLDPNEGVKSVIAAAVKVFACTSHCVFKHTSPLYFKYFLLVFSPLIMHTDGETLGFILIYIQSSFFASPPTHPPLQCIS